MAGPPRLLTSGRMAADLRQPFWRIQYVLMTRHHIRPSAIAGTVRLYDRRALAQVRHELNAIDARRAEREVAAAEIHRPGTTSNPTTTGPASSTPAAREAKTK